MFRLGFLKHARDRLNIQEPPARAPAPPRIPIARFPVDGRAQAATTFYQEFFLHPGEEELCEEEGVQERSEV